MTVATAPSDSATDTTESSPGYAIVANEILRDRGLSLTARLLYAVLDGRRASNQSRGIRVGISTLATDLAVSQSTVRRAAGELTKAGWLERRRTGRTSSWLLLNPIRTPGRMAALQRTLADSETPPRPRPDPALTPPDLPRSVTSDGSDCSPVNALQSITREDYNNTSAAAFQAASAGKGPDLKLPEIKSSAASLQDAGAHVAATTKREQTPSRDPVVQTYLNEINTACGSTLKSTRALADILRQIAAAGIPANEAALTASAWLAAKGSKIQSVNGFLASVVLPSMATGTGLDQEPAANKQTQTPPSFVDVVSAHRCGHGEREGACALCRRGTQHTAALINKFPMLENFEVRYFGYDAAGTAWQLESVPREASEYLIAELNSRGQLTSLSLTLEVTPERAARFPRSVAEIQQQLTPRAGQLVKPYTETVGAGVHISETELGISFWGPDHDLDACSEEITDYFVQLLTGAEPASAADVPEPETLHSVVHAALAKLAGNHA